jgi:GAF domain-containing protein
MKRGKACVNIVPKLSVDGKSHGWIELHAYPIRDVEGNVCGVVEHARDITERRKEERRLARQTRRLEVMEKVARLLHTRREAGLREVLETLGDYFEADMVRAWNLSDDLSQMFLREAWSRSSDMIRVPELGAAYPVPSKWSTDQFAANRVILVKNVEDIPSSAGFERNWARKFNIKAYIAVPFRQGAGPLLGFVTLVTTEHSPNWGREELDIAKGIASILASHYALDREEARLRQELLLRKEKERLLRIELRARRRESEAMVGGIADILAHGTRLIEGVAGAEPASASASTVRRLAAFHRLARAAARVADPNPEPIDLRLRLREIVEAIPERAVLALADKESRADAEPWTYDGPAEWIDEMVPLLVEMLHELGRGAPTRVSAKAVRRGAKLASLTLGFSVPCAKTGVSADRLLELIEKSQTAVADVADASAGEWSNFVFEYRILRSLVQLARGRLEPRLYPDNHIGFAHEVPGISQVVYSEQSENDLRPNK